MEVQEGQPLSTKEQESLFLPIEGYAREEIGNIVDALREAGASPQLAVGFGSAVQGKELSMFPRWDVDVLVLVKEFPEGFIRKLREENGLTAKKEKYVPVILPPSPNFLELQPRRYMGWKSPQRGVHLQLGEQSWLEEVVAEKKGKDFDFVHQIFKGGALLWEAKPGIAEEVCEKTGLPLPPRKVEWSVLKVKKQGKGNRII